MNGIKIERDVNGKVVGGIVSKAFLKRADIFGTDEYAEVQKFYEMHPTATIKAKKISSNPNKKTNKNLTYKKMEMFIETIACDDKEVKKLIGEMNKIKKVSQIQKNPYKYVLDWFKATYPDYASYDIFKNKDDDKAENIESENKVVELNVVNK